MWEFFKDSSALVEDTIFFAVLITLFTFSVYAAKNIFKAVLLYSFLLFMIYQQLLNYILFFKLYWGIINKQNCEAFKVYDLVIWYMYT